MGVRTVKTSLHFEGPDDLSVGRIRIHAAGREVIDWIGTPGNLSFRRPNIEPGWYTADITPAGVASQSVIFQVREGEKNEVFLPPFSTLSASGSNTSYFDTHTRRTSAFLPAELKAAPSEDTDAPASAVVGATHPEGVQPNDNARQLGRSGQTSRISIGISEETRGLDSFETFRSPVRMVLFAGRVELDIADDPQRDLWAAGRVRLSTAIEQVRIERCLLPLYRGGTKITVSTPAFAPADVEFAITPVEPRTRALLRALDAGSAAEVEAVREHVVDNALEADPRTAPDPWTAMLLGLLSVRFPEIFRSIDRRWSAQLTSHAGWAFDAHIIHASQILAAARAQNAAARHDAVAEVVSLFSKAQVAGSPYYRYTNQLFAELADGIAQYIAREREAVRIPASAVERFARVRRRWYRELPLQRGSGATFTWLARDADAVRTRGVLVPNRRPSGRLPGHRTLVVFEGELSAGKISMSGKAPKRPQPAPAAGADFNETVRLKIPVFHRFQTDPGSRIGRSWAPVQDRFLPEDELFIPKLPSYSGLAPGSTPPDDPNKDRFGGQSRRKGFTLDARFEPGDGRKWVAVVLTVTADDPGQVGLEDDASFILHPSFSPAEVTVMFRSGRAQLRIQAWGGFTVGVRIPRVDVNLECDLAQVPGAPHIIRTR